VPGESIRARRPLRGAIEHSAKLRRAQFVGIAELRKSRAQFVVEFSNRVISRASIFLPRS